VQGDAKVQAISAASILAKVHRDRWCEAIDAQYPHYGFAAHKGYGTALHMQALREHAANQARKQVLGRATGRRRPGGRIRCDTAPVVWQEVTGRDGGDLKRFFAIEDTEITESASGTPYFRNVSVISVAAFDFEVL
jgi:hypothetical protein